jgi:hypothetical protein
LASLRRGLCGKSVTKLLKRHNAFSISPLERKISPSLKRTESSGWGWAKKGLWRKNKRKNRRMSVHPVDLRIIDGGNIINFGQMAIVLIEINPVTYDEDVIDLGPEIICLHSNFSTPLLV